MMNPGQKSKELRPNMDVRSLFIDVVTFILTSNPLPRLSRSGSTVEGSGRLEEGMKSQVTRLEYPTPTLG